SGARRPDRPRCGMSRPPIRRADTMGAPHAHDGRCGGSAVPPQSVSLRSSQSIYSEAVEQIVNCLFDGTACAAGQQILQHLTRIGGHVLVMPVPRAPHDVADREEREPRLVVVIILDLV